MSLKNRHFQQYWEKQGRKDAFTWMHRYLRLHSELLSDSIYQKMYDYHRNTLIAYLKTDIKNMRFNDEQLGAIVDHLADVFNQDNAKQVEKYEPLIAAMYAYRKEYPDEIDEIRI